MKAYIFGLLLVTLTFHAITFTAGIYVSFGLFPEEQSESNVCQLDDLLYNRQKFGQRSGAYDADCGQSASNPCFAYVRNLDPVFCQGCILKLTIEVKQTLGSGQPLLRTVYIRPVSGAVHNATKRYISPQANLEIPLEEGEHFQSAMTDVDIFIDQRASRVVCPTNCYCVSDETLECGPNTGVPRENFPFLVCKDLGKCVDIFDYSEEYRMNRRGDDFSRCVQTELGAITPDNQYGDCPFNLQFLSNMAFKATWQKIPNAGCPVTASLMLTQPEVHANCSSMFPNAVYKEDCGSSKSNACYIQQNNLLTEECAKCKILRILIPQCEKSEYCPHYHLDMYVAPVGASSTEMHVHSDNIQIHKKSFVDFLRLKILKLCSTVIDPGVDADDFEYFIIHAGSQRSKCYHPYTEVDITYDAPLMKIIGEDRLSVTLNSCDC